jgi:RNA polymerase sigma-70 factor (ECF subfamily)
MTTKEYNRCIQLYGDAIFRFSFKHIKDRDEASDITQDAFEKLWLCRVDVDPEKVKSWLYTTAYRLVVDAVRKKNIRIKYPDYVLKHQEKTEDFDVKDIINKAFDSLPQVQKTVVLLRDYEGYSYEEIGDITGLKPSQVKVYIYRARMELKKVLDEVYKCI